MVILISGASHTGKTVLAQKLLEKYHYPYFSIDHLKMGLIRSGNTELTPCDDDKLADYLWPIVREMIKTAIENGQNLIVEGCYIPFDWVKSFDISYLGNIRDCWIILSEEYIESNYEQILLHANDIEHRLDDSDCSKQSLIEDNKRILTGCQNAGCRYILIDHEYEIGEIICPM